MLSNPMHANRATGAHEASMYLASYREKRRKELIAQAVYYESKNKRAEAKRLRKEAEQI